MKKLLLSMVLATFVFAGAKADEVVYDFTKFEYGLTRETTNDASYIENGTTCENSPITMTLFKTTGKNGMRLWSDGLRFYKSSDAGFTLSIADGGKITGVEITVVSGATFALDGEASNATSWTTDASEVKINYTATVNKALKTLKVTYTPGAVDPDALPKPEISLDGRMVTITCSDPDAQIRYTDFDGADIDTDYNVYYAPFELYMPCTVQAVAFKDGKFSDVASKVCNVPVAIDGFSGIADFVGYAVEYSDPLAVAYQANPYLWLTNGDGFVLVYGYTETVYAPGDVYQGVRGTVDSYNGLIQLKDATVGEKVEGMTMLPEPMEAEIGDIATYMQTRYLVLNGVTITGSSRKYEISLNGETATMYDSAKLFLDFVPEADKTYNVTGFVGVNNNVAQLIPVKIEEVQAELPVCEAPMFNPAAGEYTELTNVILSCATEGAAIYYTLDGTEPTVESTEYTAPIALAVDGEYTVKAIAVAEGHTASEVATAVYTIKLETGIDAIEVIEGEAEYFNLQGVRVANPTPGLYILRSAGKVVKVQVK